MRRKTIHARLDIVILFLLLLKVYVADNTKLRNVLKNSSKFGNDNRTNNDGNGQGTLKEQATKFLDQCSSNRSKSNRDTNNDERNDNYKRDYYRNFGYESEDNRRGDRTWNSYDSSRNNAGNQNGQNNDRNNPYASNSNNYDRNCNSDSSSSSSYGNSGNNNDRSNRYGSNSNSYGSNPNSYGSNSNSYGSNSNSRYDSTRGSNRNCDDSGGETSSNRNGYSRDRGYSYGQQSDYNNDNYYGSGMNSDSYGSSRMRRSSDNRENENQCTSQCVFAHMELLDDDQVPSETLVIKWVQDHVTDDDMKRISNLREIRKCFSKLSTSDIEDGCEYAKELSECLHLDLE